MIYLNNAILSPYKQSEEMSDILKYALDNRISYDASDIKPLDLLIQSLIKKGIWEKLDVFYMFAGNSSKEFKKINLINPKKHYITEAGAKTWSEEGVKGVNDSGTHLDTNYNPSIDAVNYALNNASIWTNYNKPHNSTTGEYYISSVTPGNTYLIVHDRLFSNNNTQRNIAINGEMTTSALSNVNNMGVDKMKYIGRKSSTEIVLGDKDVWLIYSNNSTSVPNDSLIFLRNINAKISCAGAGAFLTENEYNRLRASLNSYFKKMKIDVEV